MDASSAPQPIQYATLEAFEEVDGLRLTLIKAEGDRDGFLPGPPVLHLVLNAPDGAYEPVFAINPGHEDLAIAIGQGMTRALSIAKAEWDNPAPTPARRPECVVIPFPSR